jgi:hypothetical protein
MKKKNYPYVARCSFCRQGLLRPTRCGECQAIVAVCDECELIWTDIEIVFADPHAQSNGAFPECPICGISHSNWERLDADSVEEVGLGHYVANMSV